MEWGFPDKVLKSPHHFIHLICQVALYMWRVGMGNSAGMCELALLLKWTHRRSTGLACRRRGAQEPQERPLGEQNARGALQNVARQEGLLPLENLDCTPSCFLSYLLSPLEQVKDIGRKSFLKIRAGAYVVRALSGSKHEALLTAFPSPSTLLVSSAWYFQGVFSPPTFSLSRG